MFWLKKVVSFWLMPVPLCVVLLAAGALLSGPGRRTRAGRICLVLAALVFLLFSNRTASVLLIMPLEARYPALCGTIRDHVTQERRPFLRFFACEEDLSHESPDAPLPAAVASGKEPYFIIGAIAGGWM